MRPLLFLLTLILVASIAAQERPEQVALKFREEIAESVRAKKDLPEAALARLRAHASPSGLKIDRDADFALAAIDVGRRLLSVGEPAAAERFFQEAQRALDLALQRTPDAEAATKAMLLRKRAAVLADYLGQPKDALRDLEAALALRPEDQQVLKALDSLAKQHGPEFVRGRTR